MPRLARLITDPPADGPWNMAVDEALLESAARDGGPTLRLYRWAPATLSLGYFQQSADREPHIPSSRCPMVRRSSGGGAIVHDCELTYSYAVSARGGENRKAEQIYDVFHQTLIDAFAHFGIAGRPADNDARQPPSQQPFLCFLRRSRGDVLVGEAKVVGSAQRRRKTGLLQHGSILFGQSKHAPELPGLVDVGGQDLAIDELIERWIPKLCERLDIQPEQGFLTGPERRMASTLAAEKFGHPAWTQKR
jgi:lipoate-protein ligase A